MYTVPNWVHSQLHIFCKLSATLQSFQAHDYT